MGAEAEDVGGEGGCLSQEGPRGSLLGYNFIAFHDFSTQEPDSISQFSASQETVMGPAWVVSLLRGRIPRAQS